MYVFSTAFSVERVAMVRTKQAPYRMFSGFRFRDEATLHAVYSTAAISAMGDIKRYSTVGFTS